MLLQELIPPLETFFISKIVQNTEIMAYLFTILNVFVVYVCTEILIEIDFSHSE